MSSTRNTHRRNEKRRAMENVGRESSRKMPRRRRASRLDKNIKMKVEI
jgi:hypothetical protein